MSKVSYFYTAEVHKNGKLIDKPSGIFEFSSSDKWMTPALVFSKILKQLREEFPQGGIVFTKFERVQ